MAGPTRRGQTDGYRIGGRNCHNARAVQGRREEVSQIDSDGSAEWDRTHILNISLFVPASLLLHRLQGCFSVSKFGGGLQPE